MPDHRTLTWVLAGDRDPDFKDNLDHFIALDGEVEVGVVKLRRGAGRSGVDVVDAADASRPSLQAADERADADTQGSGAGTRRLLARVPGVVRD